MRKIITLSGRQGSGKTEFANIAVGKYGFKKIAIADRLKEVVSELYDIPLQNLIDPVLKQKQLDQPWVWNKESAYKLEKITGLNLTLDIEEKEFNKPREALQYIGTDVIRLVDQDFHIKECIKKIESTSDNIVIDDQRFLSEREALKRYNPIEYFITRPFHFEYSNHESEITLSRHLFNNQILNSRDRKYINRYINTILLGITNYSSDNIYYDIDYWKNLLIENNNDIAKISDKIQLSTCTINKWLKKHCLSIRHTKYNYDHNCFSYPSKLAAYISGYLAGDGCIKRAKSTKFSYNIEISSNDEESIEKFNKLVGKKKVYSRINSGYLSNNIIHSSIIYSPYMIDDLKFWNNIPRDFLNGEKNKIPDIIKNDIKYLKYWITGIIDADGGIHSGIKTSTAKNGQKYTYDNFVIDILASDSVTEYIKNILQLNCSKYVQHNNLYTLRYTNNAAHILYKELKNELCLSRKWIY